MGKHKRLKGGSKPAETSLYEEKYPLHFEVIRNNISNVSNILERMKKDNETSGPITDSTTGDTISSPTSEINLRDWHGNAPLHLACHLGFVGERKQWT